MEKILRGLMSWVRLPVALSLMLMMQCGCASTKIKDPRTGKETLNHIEKNGDLQCKVDVIVYGGICPMVYTFVNQNDMPSVPLSSFEVKRNQIQQSASSKSTGTFGNGGIIETPETTEFHYDNDDSDIVYIADLSELLLSSLERNGITVSKVDPDYRILATFERKFGDGLAGSVTWNLIMAVPSLVLPIPLLTPFDSSIEVLLYDSEYNQIDSTKIDTTAKAAFYSIWSMRALPHSIADAEADATAALVLELIRAHEMKDLGATRK